MRLQTPFLFLLLLLPFFLNAQPLFPIKKDKKWGLMNAEGRIVLDPTYDAIGEFKQFGYAVMQRNGKVGMLNSAGAEMILPRYEDLKTLDSTLITVKENGQWQVMNLAGKVILKPGYDRLEVLSFGKEKSFLAYMIGKDWGLIDADGTLLASPKYDEITLLQRDVEGVPEDKKTGHHYYFQTKKEDKFGLLLANGMEVLPPNSEEIRPFEENLFFFKINRKWGAVGADGKALLEARFDHFSRLSENFVRLTGDQKNHLYSLSTNALIINGEYEAFYPFSENYVLVKSRRLLGLVDQNGILVLPVKYNEIQPYEGDVFRANLDGRWGLVGLNDRQVIPFQYDYIAPMKDGLCVVIQNRKLGIANAAGELVVAPDFEKIELDGGVAKAHKKGKVTLYNFNDAGSVEGENSFDNYFTIKITRKQLPVLREPSDEESPYQLDKFEWFYSPKHDKWGLRRLDNGAVQIEPTFHEVRVERELGLTLVGIEMLQEIDFDKTSFRFEMAYGLVQNDTGLLVHEVDLVDVRLSDFDRGLPVARCIFLDGKHGIVNRIGKILRKDFAYIGDFSEGVARSSMKGKLSGQLPKYSTENNLGRLRNFLNAQLAPVTLTDYTQHDLNLESMGMLTCDNCSWGYVDTAGQLVVQPQFSFAKDFINDVGIVAQSDKWGMVDHKGKELLPCRYDELGFLENTNNRILRIFKKEAKYGLIDTLGRLAVGVQYEDIGMFSEGRLAVKRNGVWGFVDRNGLEVIPCRFDEVGTFSEGVAAVKLGSKWGYIDHNAGVEMDFQFSKAGEFRNGLAPAKREGPYFGYIDRKGGWVIQPRFPKAGAFDRGVARVEELTNEYRTGLIDTTGNYILKPKFFSVGEFDQNGVAVAAIGGNPLKYALVNMEGQIITSQAFREIAPFTQGLARVLYKEKYGFINTKGELVIPARFSKTSDFSEGMAAVWLDGQCGFIDTLGKFVVEPQFTRCMDFRDGKAIVFQGNQRAGLIDVHGNFVIEPGINRLLDFADGRGLVRDEHYKFYYITEQARFYDGYYDKAGQFRHGVAVVQVDGRWAIINQQGIGIIPPKYDKIEQFENGFAKVRIKGFSGLTNLQGELIVQPEYEYISFAGEGLFRVEQGDKVGYFDLEGKWVWGLQE